MLNLTNVYSRAVVADLAHLRAEYHRSEPGPRRDHIHATIQALASEAVTNVHSEALFALLFRLRYGFGDVVEWQPIADALRVTRDQARWLAGSRAA